ncbi:MAG TPA: lysylphosphatidylglycerol synthase transmembrane domain-containing protein [Actinomycetota bacterium]|nr:lysylphosphatidylglycerol synthase transmembrane domain-containing protein [Actinomycetota bacterium]
MTDPTEQPGAQAAVPDPATAVPDPAPKRLISPGRIFAMVVALIGLYVVWPSLVAVFGAVGELANVNPVWFVVMAALEAASFVCIWGLIGLCLRSRRYFLVGTSQLAGNAISRVVPGGNAVGAALQYRLLVGGGMDPTQIATGLTAASLINFATLLALPVLSVPAILGGVAVNRGLARAAWLGVGAFVLLVSGGAVLLLADRPIAWTARTIERIRNALARNRPPVVGLEGRLTHERDTVRATLGEHWAQAVLWSAGNVLFDYLALLAALVASGARPRASLVLLAYAAAIVLGMIPITPGGLGFVEAGLAAMLVLAGVPGAQATLATLAYRLVSYWGPIASGPIAYAFYRRRAGAWAARASASAAPT